MPDTIQSQIKPDWDEIEKIRISTKKLLDGRKYPSAIADTIVMVLSELLENAVKYGVYLSSIDKIEYSITLSPDSIILEVINPFNEDDNFRELDKTMQWIRGFQNPFQAYIERVKEISERPLHDMHSGLGLARIAYQGRSIVDFYLRDDNSIAVSAVYQI